MKNWARKPSSSEMLKYMHIYNKRNERNWVVGSGGRSMTAEQKHVKCTSDVFEAAAINWWNFKISSRAAEDEIYRAHRSRELSMADEIYYLLVKAFTRVFTNDGKNCLRKHKDEKWWKCNEGNNECQSNFKMLLNCAFDNAMWNMYREQNTVSLAFWLIDVQVQLPVYKILGALSLLKF